MGEIYQTSRRCEFFLYTEVVDCSTNVCFKMIYHKLFPNYLNNYYNYLHFTKKEFAINTRLENRKSFSNLPTLCLCQH